MEGADDAEHVSFLRQRLDEYWARVSPTLYAALAHGSLPGELLAGRHAGLRNGEDCCSVIVAERTIAQQFSASLDGHSLASFFADVDRIHRYMEDNEIDIDWGDFPDELRGQVSNPGLWEEMWCGGVGPLRPIQPQTYGGLRIDFLSVRQPL